MNRNGSVMLTFFPAIGQRKYDYAKKQVNGSQACKILVIPHCLHILVLDSRPNSYCDDRQEYKSRYSSINIPSMHFYAGYKLN